MNIILMVVLPRQKWLNLYRIIVLVKTILITILCTNQTQFRRALVAQKSETNLYWGHRTSLMV